MAKLDCAFECCLVIFVLIDQFEGGFQYMNCSLVYFTFLGLQRELNTQKRKLH